VSVRILSDRDVAKLLPMAECVDVMAQALATLANGDAVLPLRSMVRLPGGQQGLLGLMPAYLGDPACFGLKAVTVMPQNHGTEYESHQGVVLLFEVEHGCLLAVMDASSVTAIRTAAVSGAATRALAREDAGDLAILGSGVQADSHLAAMRAVRKIRRVRVWSRSSANARAFAERHVGQGIGIEVCDSARAAVDGADLVCTTTAAREPILAGEWLAPGAHINAVGACFKDSRELDSDAVARSRLYVDRLESALNEAGDILLAIRGGAIGEDHILGELGEVLVGRVEGRLTPDDVTLFESLGIAIEDLAAAHYVHRKAEAQNVGVALELGGKRHAHA
jgi:ornithine cyclodeaminase/alanine dehydrogenase-like protein (mu-crystallin family)